MKIYDTKKEKKKLLLKKKTQKKMSFNIYQVL